MALAKATKKKNMRYLCEVQRGNHIKFYELFQIFSITGKRGSSVPRRQTNGEVKVTPVRQMEEHKKPHKEIYAPFKRGTLTHPRQAWGRRKKRPACSQLDYINSAMKIAWHYFRMMWKILYSL